MQTHSNQCRRGPVDVAQMRLMGCTYTSARMQQAILRRNSVQTTTRKRNLLHLHFSPKEQRKGPSEACASTLHYGSVWLVLKSTLFDCACMLVYMHTQSEVCISLLGLSSSSP